MCYSNTVLGVYETCRVHCVHRQQDYLGHVRRRYRVREVKKRKRLDFATWSGVGYSVDSERSVLGQWMVSFLLFLSRSPSLLATRSEPRKPVHAACRVAGSRGRKEGLGNWKVRQVGVVVQWVVCCSWSHLCLLNHPLVLLCCFISVFTMASPSMAVSV
jgi:hypothetical protein